MKRIALLLPLLLSTLTPAFAGTIPKEEISADAKWVIHLEASQFRASKVGGFITTEMLEAHLKKPVQEASAKLKLNVDVPKIVDGIKSITIYGTDYDSPETHSVLLLRLGPDLEQILVGALAGLALEGTNSPIKVVQTQLGHFAFYDIQGAACCAVLPGKVIAVGRSREITETAAKVIDGKAPCLDSGKAFGGFADMKEAFFFMGVAEGFNMGKHMPEEAKLLQVADAGRIVLGEDDNQLYLSLALRGKTPDAVTQMQQVMQGLIAIGSLSQPQDKDVAQLLNSVKVTTDDNNVNVRVAYPVDRAIDHLVKARDQMMKEDKPEADGNDPTKTPATPKTPKSDGDQ